MRSSGAYAKQQAQKYAQHYRANAVVLEPATSAGRGTGFGPFTFIVTSGCQEASFFQASFHVPGHSIERLRSVEHRMLCRRRGETVGFSAYLLGHETPPADLGHRSVRGFFFRAAKSGLKRIRLIIFAESYM